MRLSDEPHLSGKVSNWNRGKYFWNIDGLIIAEYLIAEFSGVCLELQPAVNLTKF